MTRLTRAKAAAAGGLQPTALDQANTAATQRKRAALGDLSTNASKDQAKSGKLMSVASTAAAATAASRARRTGLSNASNNNAATKSNGTAARKPLGTKTNTTNKTNVHNAKTTTTTTTKTNIAVYDESKANANNNNAKTTHRLEHETENTRALKKPKTEHHVEPTEAKKADQSWDDLDAEDADDPLMVSEYVVEIFDYLYDLQKKYMPNPNYMDDQKHLEWEMRGVLVDWLVEVHCKFKLLPETLFLAINIVDRFMSARVVSLNKVQLVGIAALFIAAKCEEVYTPAIQNYAYISDGGYEEDDILNAERFVLQVLSFEMSYPNPLNFLRRISKADNYDIQTRTIAKYLLEISLLDHRLMKYLPSDVAAAAMYLARKILDRGDWTANLIHYSGGCDQKKLYPIVAIMVDYLAAPVVHDGFFKKYASKRFLKASIIARQWAKNNVQNYPLD
ncbi:hypothetical protein TRICI_003161 [Trichomonascus ciferrii]|uniref:Cyclin N-terminal domain-containing protein n=1 Tax=Trichomonascus ciferrii TaxID=44093 RepID=A0A642V3W1_9ASCO|nr:hypothetical protein TRICI_003161 [Trichomonascus ciferrii]